MKDIIELAKQAGFYTDRGMIWVEGWEISPFMQRFAALVRAQTLEEAAVACEDLDEEASWKEDRLASGHECAAALRERLGETK